jgi:DSF synthase
MNTESTYFLENTYQHLITKFEPDYGIMWYSMDPKPRPCMTIELLQSVRRVQKFIEQMSMLERNANGEHLIRYGVLASNTAGVYSLGGDMELFQKLIAEKNSNALRDYAVACIDCVFSNYTLSLTTPVTTIGLVQGDALGAFSLLSRRLDAKRAEQIILGGNIYSAKQLHDWGVVDVLAENGGGEKALYEYVVKHSRKRNAYQAFHKVRQTYNPITYGEMMDVTLVWVEAALNLGPKDLRLMERLVKAQEKISKRSPVAGVGGGDYA